MFLWLTECGWADSKGPTGYLVCSHALYAVIKCHLAQLRSLQEQLAVREQEVAALREIAEAASQLQAQDVQAAKIIELSKRVSWH